MHDLTLDIRSFTSPSRWYWSLSDRGGGFIADHEASLPRDDPQWEAFTRLDRYLRRHVDRDRPLASEAEIIGWLGQWLATHAFGSITGALSERPVATVCVRFAPHLPPEASSLLFRPWELAVVNGRPLASQNVSLVMVPPGAGEHHAKEKTGGRLRMLAVFSLPDDAPSLVLREQRHALVRLTDRIAKTRRKAIDLAVLQYDMTRDKLREALEEGEGWDIVHFSGHGLSDGLVFEAAAGGQEIVPAHDLVDLLGIARHRLKLLVLSSCNSAAAPPAASLAARFGEIDNSKKPGEGRGPRTLPAVGAEAARVLDCAVLAMRYKVDDDFSIALTDHLYESLLGSGQPLTRALQLALPKSLCDPPRPGSPPLSAGIPALFGEACVDLSLSPPPASPPKYDVRDLPMASFPPEPDHLVGRSAPMARASRAMAGYATGPAGLLLTGPEGIGKSACATELAYRHQGTFATLAYWQPGDRSRFAPLTGFAESMDRQLEGLGMSAAVTSAAALDTFLPRLTELMERGAILLVLDGLDGLLTSGGDWRDPLWGKTITALLDHRGLSRVLLTSRRPPKDLPPGTPVESLPPLSPEESVLLARQLPALGALLRGTGGTPIKEARRRAARVLTSAVGVPAELIARDKTPAPADESVVTEPDLAYARLVNAWTAEL